jgi:hypothetical protein
MSCCLRQYVRTRLCKVCGIERCLVHFDQWGDRCDCHTPPVCKICGRDILKKVKCNVCPNIACIHDGCGKQGNALYFCHLHLFQCAVCACALSPVKYGAVPYHTVYDATVCLAHRQSLIEMYLNVRRILPHQVVPRVIMTLILTSHQTSSSDP